MKGEAKMKTKKTTLVIMFTAGVLLLGQVCPIEAAMVGYWKMDENAATTVADSAGNNNLTIDAT